MKRSRTRSALLRRRLPQQAAALAAAVPVEMLHAAATEEIRACSKHETIAIACSGGADSVALLLLLWAHFPERRARWLILHFNHRLRGRASNGDAAFVRALAHRLGERCVVGRWTQPRVRPREHVAEADARDARWAFFHEAMRKARVRVIALGHQLDDVAETMLMRLTRGSGSAGLAAPRPAHQLRDGTTRVRPLLSLPAAALRDRLRASGIEWREDRSNATDAFLRNRIRRQVLPPLVAVAGRNALPSFADSRAQLDEDDRALEAWLDSLVPPPSRGREPYDLSALRGKPAALVRRAIHRWAGSMGLTPSPSKGAVDWLVRAICEGRAQRLSAGPGRFIVVDNRTLSLVAAGDLRLRDEPWDSQQLRDDRALVGPRGDRLEMRVVKLSARLYQRIRSGEFPQATTAFVDPGAGWPGWLGVRAWQPGDRYRPIGAAGRAKLQDLFVNHRVPRELRPLLPVILNCQGNVIWVPGLRLAAEAAVQPAAKLVVQLTYTPAPPMVHRSKASNSSDVRSR